MVTKLFLAAMLLSPLQIFEGKVKQIPQEIHCKAVAIWHEARGEPIEGQRAVLDVIRNRVVKEQKSACEVLQRHRQFSFVHNKLDWTATPKQLELFYRVKKFPAIFNEEYLWFLRHDLKRVWTKDMKCSKIGNHKFCRMKGN